MKTYIKPILSKADLEELNIIAGSTPQAINDEEGAEGGPQLTRRLWMDDED